MASNSQEIGSLIEKMTTNGYKQIDESLMKKVKKYCKQNDCVDQVFRMIKLQLEKPHSQIRYSTLLIIDELFLRSHRFRCLLLINENLQKFFELTLGINEDKPLPPPKKCASDLKKKSIELIEKWYKKFAEGYPSLKSAYNHFKSSTINFRELEIMRETERQKNEAEQARKKQLLKEKIIKTIKTFDEFKMDCDRTLIEADNCFNLLYPNFSNDDQVCDNQHLDDRFFLNKVNNDINISVKSQIEITKNLDNEPLIENMKDIYKQIVSQHLPRLKNLLKEMSKGVEFCSENIKMAIDLKSQLLQVIQKYFELKIIDQVDYEKKKEFQESSESDFEEVPEKDLELIIPQHRWKEYGLLKSNKTLDEPLTRSDSNIQMCKFPLPNGKLCPRRDKIKCPFHGKIIDRNEVGVALNLNDFKREIQESEKKKAEEWQNPIFLKEIEDQIGIDLKVKKKKKSKSNSKSSLLQNVKTCDQTSRDRLQKKIFNKSAQKRAVDCMNMQNKNFHSHFEDQWNYAMEN